MVEQFRFYLNRIRERLWVRPLFMCVVSVAAVFLAYSANGSRVERFFPDISADSIQTLLSIIAGSMMAVATFAVASMVSAYASASSTATPRSFPLIIADDVSQNALSTFIGAFIFSIVALVALTNGSYDKSGRFALFALTLLVFAVVILTFVRWVDRIARLGRSAATIAKVEAAAAAAMVRRRAAPTLCGLAAGPVEDPGQAICGDAIGYVQRVDVAALQRCGEKLQLRIRVVALPGAFAAPGKPLVYVSGNAEGLTESETSQITCAFLIGSARVFDEDPRFGLVVLAEIASRALSPAVNDAGTAIGILGSYVRLFVLWRQPIDADKLQAAEFNRVSVAELSLWDMFDDAFTAIARDGAGVIEVAGRLQKVLQGLASAGDAEMRHVAIQHSRWALARAEKALEMPQDLEQIRKLAAFSAPGGVNIPR